MPIYTVHVPETVPDLVTQADRTVFLREGFSLRAFFFGLLFLLWHRLWLASAVWTALVIGCVVLWSVLHPPLLLLVALFGLMHLYLGAEGADLARWALSRRGLATLDVVSAPGLEEAEAVYFGRHMARLQDAPRPARRITPPMPTLPAVIGFSDMGRP